MHDAAYSQAALPAPARVLGLNLRPYSLGHELWLIREQNPLAVQSGETVASKLVAALPAAVLFCSQTFEQISAMNRDRFISLKLWLWNLRLRRHDGLSELASFLEYRTRGSLAFPDEPADGRQSSRPLGAPFLLSLYNYLRAAGDTDSGAWNHPYGLAQMRYAAWLETEGHLKIKNAFDIEHDRAFEEWEKANPGSSLKMEETNDA